jgi:hypothetical protein
MIPGRGTNGRFNIVLKKKGVLWTRGVHRLIIETFKGLPPKGFQCCHNDGNVDNNRIENLRWDTRENNELDKFKHGTSPKGERNPCAKLTEEQVIEIRKLYNTGSFSHKDLGKIYNVDQANIGYIVRRKSWAHI